MAFWVQKYGGTSVANTDCILHVAGRILQARAAGHRIVVVLSAMAGDTDRLCGFAQSVAYRPDLREKDALLAAGEQVTVALLAMALSERGCPARSFFGTQIPVRTDRAHAMARITGVDSSGLQACLDAGIVPVIAGFQGVDPDGQITTLGRGGSDTTAVAVAAALEADECQIYTDVDGVYTADPRLLPEARRLARITFSEMLAMASNGAKVLQMRSVELAARYRVPLRVLSTFQEGAGTRITQEEDWMEQAIVTGIAVQADMLGVHLVAVPEDPGLLLHFIDALTAYPIRWENWSQHLESTEGYRITFAVEAGYRMPVIELLQAVFGAYTRVRWHIVEHVCKLTLVGAGIRTEPRIMNTVWATLQQANVPLMACNAGDTAVILWIHQDALPTALAVLHEACVPNKS